MIIILLFLNSCLSYLNPPRVFFKEFKQDKINLELQLRDTNDQKDINRILFVAISKGYISVTKLAIEKGANLKYKSIYGNTLLMIAVENYNEKIIKYLLSLNLDVNEKNDNGRTALMIAVFCNEIRAIDMLLRYKADIEIQDNNGYNFLMHAVDNENLVAIRFAVYFQAKINNTNNKGQTALIISVINSKILSFKYLIELGVDVSVIDKTGHNALLYAIENNSLELVQLLLKQGAKIDFIGAKFIDLFLKAKQDIFELTYYDIQEPIKINILNKCIRRYAIENIYEKKIMLNKINLLINSISFISINKILVKLVKEKIFEKDCFILLISKLNQHYVELINILETKGSSDISIVEFELGKCQLISPKIFQDKDLQEIYRQLSINIIKFLSFILIEKFPNSEYTQLFQNVKEVPLDLANLIISSI